MHLQLYRHRRINVKRFPRLGIVWVLILKIEVSYQQSASQFSLRVPTHIEQKVKGLFFQKNDFDIHMHIFCVITCLNYQIVYIL